MTPEEINRFIAEKVMGLHLDGISYCQHWYDSDGHKQYPFDGWDYFDPYHRIDHAMMALEKVDYWTIYRTPNVYHVILGSEDNPTPLISAMAYTPSSAICLALIEAKRGVKWREG